MTKKMRKMAKKMRKMMSKETEWVPSQMWIDFFSLPPLEDKEDDE